ncbi:MAG: hypothetical protein Q3990_02600, partial [Desulfovibrionaceae bacterium]|nr:hypothetical protein [Desulfovibrionaceae bacterium]
MKLTNTAGLAALVLVCPLAATAVYGSGNYDYDVHYNDTPDASGKVASSGYEETVTGEHFDIYIGHASGSGEKVKALESSNNVGILCAGSEGYRIYGGYAETAGDADVEACFNKITVEEGSEGGSVTTAGWARAHNNASSSQGSATASGNECYITNQASSLNYGGFRGGVSLADTGD